MYLKKAICLCLFAAAVLTTAFAFGRIEQENRGAIKADGGAPEPPPIPWDLAGAGTQSLVV
jgi:hypothetical protein